MDGWMDRCACPFKWAQQQHRGIVGEILSQSYFSVDGLTLPIEVERYLLFVLLLLLIILLNERIFSHLKCENSRFYTRLCGAFTVVYSRLKSSWVALLWRRHGRSQAARRSAETEQTFTGKTHETSRKASWIAAVAPGWGGRGSKLRVWSVYRMQRPMPSAFSGEKSRSDGDGTRERGASFI